MSEVSKKPLKQAEIRSRFEAQDIAAKSHRISVAGSITLHAADRELVAS